MWSVIATWPFSLQAVEKAAGVLAEGEDAVTAAEKGIWLVESDPYVESVGRGGFLNADGELELDAAVMDGDTLKMGAVAGVKGYEHPVSIARAVMEKTRHSILVGSGAEAFARKMGFEPAGEDRLITEAARQVWQRDREKSSQTGHDTIGMVALDQKGSMAAATSTSGASMKVPGRVGDSPIIGSGFYVETGVGGAAATGLGEDIMRTCLSFRAVEYMRAGMSPKAAAEKAVLSAHNTILRRGLTPDCMALVCMNDKGECGGAANHQGFGYAFAVQGEAPRFVAVDPVVDKDASGR